MLESSLVQGLGNHDWWWDGRRVKRGLEANGIKVLDDEVVELKARGKSVWLAMLSPFYWTSAFHIPYGHTLRYSRCHSFRVGTLSVSRSTAVAWADGVGSYSSLEETSPSHAGSHSSPA